MEIYTLIFKKQNAIDTNSNCMVYVVHKLQL